MDLPRLFSLIGAHCTVPLTPSPPLGRVPEKGAITQETHMARNNIPAATHRIMQSPEIMAGKPVVGGTRIPVERVLAHLAHHPDLNDLFAAYPELTPEDVKACLAYASEVIGRKSAPARRTAAEHSAPAHL
jgi:uncharacterized protein (DUF433 family)